MIPEGAGVTCPSCRLFADLVAQEAPGHVVVRCPWCGVASTLAQWASCADIDKCEACGHPKAMHACYGTNDGEAPSPAKAHAAQHVTVEAAPCAHCKCTASSGAEMVRLS